VEAVERVTRLMERRTVRRAADQALMTPTYLRQLELADTPITTLPIETRADPWGETRTQRLRSQPTPSSSRSRWKH
jgi:hypothetical protein